MKQLRRYIRRLLMEQDDGILGKSVWPTASRTWNDTPAAWPKLERDTEIEELLYIQLNKHFGYKNPWGKDQTSGLKGPAIDAIKQIVDAGWYPEIFRRCESGTMLRGMRVTPQWIMENVPQAFEALPETVEDPFEFHSLIDASFAYESTGRHGAVSSWTPSAKVAASFTLEWSANTVPCILHAKCSSGYFIDTWPFAYFEGGRYKGDLGIKKLNPQGKKEKEYILLGDCEIVAVQLKGTKSDFEKALKK